MRRTTSAGNEGEKAAALFVNLAPTVAYTDTNADQVLDYLASNLYTGHGAHSMFMKTWAAGLAYSNGLRPRISEGTLHYYAERCPLLPQTLRFEDYRDVGGLRLPFRWSTEDEGSGKIVAEIESFEAGLELPADYFARPAPASGPEAR